MSFDPQAPSKITALLLIAFMAVVIGFFVFPNMNTEISSVNTTGWLPILGATHSMFPYVYLAAIAWGIIVVWFTFKGRGGE